MKTKYIITEEGKKFLKRFKTFDLALNSNVSNPTITNIRRGFPFTENTLRSLSLYKKDFIQELHYIKYDQN